MPAGFNKCRESGGRIRTIKPNASTYMAVCYKGGKSYAGERHTMKKAPAGYIAKALDKQGAKA